MMKPILYLIVTAAIIISCEKTNPDPLTQSPKDLGLTQKTTDIIQSDNEFGIAMFKEAVSSDAESENVFISPTSIALAIAMVYNGAVGETKTAIEVALRKQGFTVEEINAGYKSLMEALLSADQRVLLEIANSIWYREGFNVLPQFISANQDYYNAEVSSLDFNDEAAVGIINNWVDDKTHGCIDQIINEISDATVMFLINAIYFKGIWKFEFEKPNTEDGTFYLKEGSNLTVPMMKQTTALPHYSNEVFSMVELPYGRGNYSMVVLLPNSNHSTDDIISSLSQENWDSWIAGLIEQNIDLVMPRFKFGYKNTLNDELTAMGMELAFLPGVADFSGINGTGGLFISRVLHKTFVEVNEEGTEAAAVTAVVVDVTSIGPDENIFNVDHPFIFAIRETTTGAILFIGRVQDPSVEENGE